MRKLNYLIPAIDNAVQAGMSITKALDFLRDKAKTDKIKQEDLRPVVMERCAAYYKVTLLTFSNGKEKLDSNGASYEACRKAMNRILWSIYGAPKKMASANTDPVARVAKSAAKWTKPQIKRAIKALEALL